MAIDMSPEAIERRLEQVSVARKLGASLQRAGQRIRDDALEDRARASRGNEADRSSAERTEPR